MIKQVIFDLGRVLLEWEPEKLANELAKENEDFHHDVWKITKHPTWLEFDMGLLRSPDLIDIHAGQYPTRSLEMFMARVPHILTPLPEGIRLFEIAKKQGLKLYILSNMSHDFYEHLVESYPFLQEFDGSVYSCHFNLAKPDLAIYKTVLNQYNLDPAETLFIDDIPENIAAAESLGIQGLVFTKSEETYKKFLEKIGAE